MASVMITIGPAGNTRTVGWTDVREDVAILLLQTLVQSIGPANKEE